MQLTYPNARIVDQTDNYHGTLVPDPYRWLEAVDSPETLEWIRQQNELTFSILEKIPARQKIKKRLAARASRSQHSLGRWHGCSHKF
jgi:prolyl oligopeptidase